jgi:hypothetical protein
MTKLIDLLKHANTTRNKQAHRIVGGSKRARQFLAEYKQSDKHIPTGQGNKIDTKPPVPESGTVSIDIETRGPDSKTDI